MATPPFQVDPSQAEDAYCEARAVRYIGDERVRKVCDRELEAWLKAERAQAREELQTRLACIRALMLHLQTNLESAVGKLEQAVADRAAPSYNAADVPELVAKARTVFELWRAYASQEMYGELLRDGMDRMDFDLLYDTMLEMRGALGPFLGADDADDASAARDT